MPRSSAKMDLTSRDDEDSLDWSIASIVSEEGTTLAMTKPMLNYFPIISELWQVTPLEEKTKHECIVICKSTCEGIGELFIWLHRNGLNHRAYLSGESVSNNEAQLLGFAELFHAANKIGFRPLLHKIEQHMLEYVHEPGVQVTVPEFQSFVGRYNRLFRPTFVRPFILQEAVVQSINSVNTLTPNGQPLVMPMRLRTLGNSFADVDMKKLQAKSRAKKLQGNGPARRAPGRYRNLDREIARGGDKADEGDAAEEKLSVYALDWDEPPSWVFNSPPTGGNVVSQSAALPAGFHDPDEEDLFADESDGAADCTGRAGSEEVERDVSDLDGVEYDMPSLDEVPPAMWCREMPLR